jgi:hypothetical protein
MVTLETSELNILELDNEKKLVDLLYKVGSKKIAIALSRALDYKDTKKPLGDNDRFVLNEVIRAFIELNTNPVLVIERT